MKVGSEQVSDENKDKWEVLTNTSGTQGSLCKNGKHVTEWGTFPVEGLKLLAMHINASVERASLSGEKEPLSDDVKAVLQNALKECPWPEDVWPTSLDRAGRMLRRMLGDDGCTAISGTLMRHGWQCAEEQVKKVLSEHDGSQGTDQVNQTPSIAAPVTPKSEALDAALSDINQALRSLNDGDIAGAITVLTQAGLRDYGKPVSSPAGSSTKEEEELGNETPATDVNAGHATGQIALQEFRNELIAQAVACTTLLQEALRIRDYLAAHDAELRRQAWLQAADLALERATVIGGSKSASASFQPNHTVP